MKHIRHHRITAAGFTLAEVVVSVGIAAGALTLVMGLMSVLSRDVARLKPYEATRRLAFQAESKASTSTTSNTTNNDHRPLINQRLPDEQLDPTVRGPDETTPKTNPDDPTSAPPTNPANGGTPPATTPDGSNATTPPASSTVP